MIRAWRLVKQKYASSALNGEGARLNPGRWNAEGEPMTYLAENLSLAALEILVHVEHVRFMPQYVAIEVGIPPELIQNAPEHLDPRVHSRAQRFGSAWLQNAESPALRVPSVIIPQESLFLINPRHPSAESLKIHDAVPFQFDPRLKVG